LKKALIALAVLACAGISMAAHEAAPPGPVIKVASLTSTEVTPPAATQLATSAAAGEMRISREAGAAVSAIALLPRELQHNQARPLASPVDVMRKPIGALGHDPGIRRHLAG
jgi:hypothetical protein